MQINERTHGCIRILKLQGWLLCEPETVKVRERIYRFVNAGIKQIIIDLGGVEHINSCGLGMLVSMLATLRKAGGDLGLACLGQNVLRVFRITKLVGVFNIFGTVNDALDSYKHRVHNNSETEYPGS